MSIEAIPALVNTVAQDDERLILLMLDDQEDILKSLTRVLRKEYQLVGFTRGEDALDYLNQHPVDLILSDMRMPQMNGAQFLAASRAIQPNAVRLLLTGYSETEAAVEAINQGGIHTYLSKPWDNQALRLSLSKAAEFYLLQQERNRLLQTLADKNRQLKEANTSLEQKVTQRTKSLVVTNERLEKLLTSHRSLYKDLLAMLSMAVGYRKGNASGNLERLAMQSRKVALQLELSDRQASLVQISALLHNVGLLATSCEEIATPSVAAVAPNRAGQVGVSQPDKQKLALTEKTLQMLQSLNRFQSHQAVIRHLDENYDGSGVPAHLCAEDIPIESRIIRVVRDYENMLAGECDKTLVAPRAARQQLRQGCGAVYDPRVVDAFLTVQHERPQNETGDLEYCIGVEELQPGQVLSRDLVLSNGNTMLTSGSTLTTSSVERIREYARQRNEPLAVCIA